MATNQVNDLGSATGRIIIDVSSLESAQAVAQSVAASIGAAMEQINKAQTSVFGNGIAQAVQSEAQTVQAAVTARTQAIEDGSEAWIEADVEAMQVDDDLTQEIVSNASTVISAQADVTQATQASVNARIAAVESETTAVVAAMADQTKAVTEAAAEQSQVQNGAGGTASAFSGTRPTGLARSVFSLGFAAQGLGLSGLAQPAFAVGGLAQVVEEIPLFNNQIEQMATRLLSMDGVFGQLARTGGNVALALGMEGEGLGASLLTMGAVALPIVAVIGLVALALGQLGQTAQTTADALKAEADINAQIAGGATSTDLQKQIDDTTNKQQGYQDTIKQVQDLLNATDKPTRQQLTDLTGIDPTSLNGVQNILLALKGLQGQADALIPTIAQLKLAQNSQGVATNDLTAAADADAQALLKEGDFKRQLAQESVQQLQQQLSDTKAAQAALGAEINNDPLISGDLKTKLGAQFYQMGVQIQDIGAALNNANLQQAAQGALALNSAYAQIQQTTARTTQDRNIQSADSLFGHITAGIRSAEDQALQFAQQQDDFARQEARAQADFDSNRALEQRDFNQQAEQAAQDHEARMAQITLDARQSILQDAQHLDALAVYNDEQRRNQQLADETTSYNQQTDQRAAAFAQQLQDQQDQFNLQRSRQQDDFALQNQRQSTQYQLQQSRQAEDWTTQNQRQQAQYQLQDQRTAQDDASQLAALSAHYNLMDFTQNYWLTRLQNGWSAFFQGIPLPPQIQPISGQYTSGASAYSVYGGSNGQAHITTGDIHIHGDFSGTDNAAKVSIVEEGLRAFFSQGLAGKPT